MQEKATYIKPEAKPLENHHIIGVSLATYEHFIKDKRRVQLDTSDDIDVNHYVTIKVLIQGLYHYKEGLYRVQSVNQVNDRLKLVTLKMV